MTFTTAIGSAQSISTYKLNFFNQINSSNIKKGKFYILPSGKDSFQINNLKYYISNIEFLNDNKIVWQESNSFHLIDMNSSSSQTIELIISSKTSFNKIQFYLGIDSVTNVSGAQGGDLDPTKGMYWTWQSGYINFKMEGKSNLCSANKNEFEFHLGGYQNEDLAVQKIILKKTSANKTDIYFDLDNFISQIDLKTQYKIMSPGGDAVKMIQIISKTFSSLSK